MKLVHKENGNLVQIGDLVCSHRGEQASVTGWTVPHKPSSSGFVSLAHGGVDMGRFYPSVAGLQFIEREDRGWSDVDSQWTDKGIGGHPFSDWLKV